MWSLLSLWLVDTLLFVEATLIGFIWPIVEAVSLDRIVREFVAEVGKFTIYIYLLIGIIVCTRMWWRPWIASMARRWRSRVDRGKARKALASRVTEAARLAEVDRQAAKLSKKNS